MDIRGFLILSKMFKIIHLMFLNHNCIRKKIFFLLLEGYLNNNLVKRDATTNFYFCDLGEIICKNHFFFVAIIPLHAHTCNNTENEDFKLDFDFVFH